MKVKMLRTPAAGFGCTLVEGQVGEVVDELGKTLICRGLAVRVGKPAEPLKAVPAKPAIAETKPAPIAGKARRQKQVKKTEVKES